MTTQYTPILKLALPVTGELSGLWGDVVNENITSMVEQAIAGLATINSWTTNSHTLTTADGTTSESRCAMLVADDDGAGNPSAAATIVCPNATKLYVLKNISGQTVTLKTAAGSGVAVPNNQTAFLFCDGTNVNSAVTTLVAGGTINGDLSVTGNMTLGDSGSDTVTINGKVTTDIIPSTDNTKDLGTVANSWRTLYLDTSALIANISIVGNTISSTDTNGNITLQPNGTGDIYASADTLIGGDLSVTGNVILGDSSSDTVAINGKVTTDIIPSTDNTKDLGTAANSWRTLYLDTSALISNISIVGNTISSTDTNGNIALQPNGTGDVILSADTVQVGDAGATATITTNGAGNLVLNTNGGTNSGSITIANGANANITIQPNGTGDIYASADTLYVGDSGASTTIASNGGGNLSLYAGVNSIRFESATVFADTAASVTGSLKFNTDAFVIDATNKRIGVGIANPSYAAHIIGSISASAYASNRIPYIDSSTSGLFVDSANLTFSSNNLTVNGVAIGRGNGNISSNTRVGYNTLATNSSGAYNTAIGYNAISNNGTGSFITAVGYDAAYSTSGPSNTAVGYQALRSVGAGSANVAVGTGALAVGPSLTINDSVAVGYNALNQATGSYNTVVGSEAMSGTLCSGSYNSAFGYRSAQNITSGQYNNAFGYDSLHSNGSGTNNCGVGFFSLYSNIAGSHNVGFGSNSLSNVTSDNNVGIGSLAGSYISTGTNNTCIGYSAGVDPVAFLTTQSNYVVLGNNSTTNANIKVAWTVTSDARDKTDFGSVPYGLDFVSKLKPTAYKYRKDRESNEAAEGARTRYGFLAQDILPLEIHGGVIIDETDPDNLKFNESSLIPVLVNAIKELKAEVDALKTKLAGA